MSFDGRAIANFVLDTCDSEGRAITNLSLQKIVYFCHVWTLAKLGKPLVKQNFEAWQYGPVLQYLYREFKDFESRPITSRAKKINPLTGHAELVEYSFDLDTQSLLRKIVTIYSGLSAGSLVDLSHVKGGPWDKAWSHNGRVNPGMIIDNENISNFYAGLRAPSLS
ncbi:DUF4065 domain-containing protein [Rhodanobacter glycinis]|uniref:DUF4065 domain-containing protein n=1 Tax=Rhodanobacter glycinis TaxID=582702 RepID=A0A502BT59_9GAMM|nr:type II toxin-antitoxin system antitoxin SocA domain-containing protein [Rhodanobacter glycinis]TPG04007.1 DUF4065 domain-containing protein [Rhodanobacter glycinis]